MQSRFANMLKKALRNKVICNTVFCICLIIMLSLIASSGYMAYSKFKVKRSGISNVSAGKNAPSSSVVSNGQDNASSAVSSENQVNKGKHYVKIGKHKVLVDPSVKKTCYLTFDDGPSDNTLKILDILKEKNAKATFFIVGKSKVEYLDDIAKSGNAIGVHTYNHVYKKIYSSTDAYMKDFDKANEVIKKHTGKTVNIFRFPGGSSNTVSRRYKPGIMTSLTKKMTKKGYYYFDWNVDSTDAENDHRTVKQLLNNVKSEVSYRVADKKYVFKTDICVLMHDTTVKKSTVEALPKIIDFLRDCGYDFDVLSENSAVFHHGVNN